MTGVNPYTSLPERAFWKPSVAQRHRSDIAGLWEPKFEIDKAAKVATYGSCFAQHIGRALLANGYTWLTTERAPPELSAANAKRFNYGIFSSRTANIYTTTLLRQWVDWAGGEQAPKEHWEQGGRVYDPFRPNIEPNGFESRKEMLASRDKTIAAFRESVTDASVFVFTLGLTESWFDVRGYEYPICPGTVAGEYNADCHTFRNQQYNEILEGLTTAIDKIVAINPNIKVLLTVSPVPLTATASGQHVLVATTESKSILRAVAGAVARERSNVDYFPSYEIVSSPVFRGEAFEPNVREVNARGVAFVMEHFFRGQWEKFGQPKSTPEVKAQPKPTEDDLVCEEELLDAYRSVG